MELKELFDRINLEEVWRAPFFELHDRCSDKHFCDSVELAYILFRRGDDVFAPFLEEFARSVGILPDVMNLYLYFRFTEHLKQLYELRGYPDEVFYDSLLALAATGRTHYKRCGVFGVLQPRGRNWFRRLFGLSIFRFGRLEFELIPAPLDIEIDGKCIKKGELCVTTHIPGVLKLDPALCEKAYENARCFFKKYFGIEELFFFCDSWLLHPWLKEHLKENSGILQFQSKYRILSTQIDPGDVIEHVFTRFRENIDEYPDDTSLSRAVKERLKKGLPLGTGIGVRL